MLKLRSMSGRLSVQNSKRPTTTRSQRERLSEIPSLSMTTKLKLMTMMPLPVKSHHSQDPNPVKKVVTLLVTKVKEITKEVTTKAKEITKLPTPTEEDDSSLEA
jgi:hypothetical protein